MSSNKKISILVKDARSQVAGGAVVLANFYLDEKNRKNYIFNGLKKATINEKGICEFEIGNFMGANAFVYLLPYKVGDEIKSGVVFFDSNNDIDYVGANLNVDSKSVLSFSSNTEAAGQYYVGETVTATIDAINCSDIKPIGRVWEGSAKGFSSLINSKGINKCKFEINYKPVGDSDVEEAFKKAFGNEVSLIIGDQKNDDLKSLNIEELKLFIQGDFLASDKPAKPISGNILVSHTRKVTEPTEPMSFFVHLLDSSKSIDFGAYQKFINDVLCSDPSDESASQYKEKLIRMKNELVGFGVGSYELLKTATEIFLLLNGSITLEERGVLKTPLHSNLDLGDYSRVPQENWVALFSNYLGDNRKSYIRHIVETALPDYSIPEKGKDPRFCTDILIRSRVNNPCFMELIWNYWHEEAMLVQTINAVSRRFQNLRAPGERDPLAHVEIDPLRPLNNILWGYVEEERDRLSIKRRAYEYQHQYGLELYGKAVSNLRPADSRSKFLEAFHNLLNKCADYFRAKQDTTVDPDGYPMLHAIQELNLILAHGAHNQFGDLAWTARVEMLIQEWILSRPEIRDFLQSRIMVPHKEAWMPQVDTMKNLQSWSDVPATHFRDLGVMGEQILLTIRWHNWYEVSNEDEAKGWADLMRPYIQSYIHAYRAVTGVDLSATDGVDFTMPSVLLRKRLASQHAPR
jgi:hypothetical protein